MVDDQGAKSLPCEVLNTLIHTAAFQALIVAMELCVRLFDERSATINEKMLFWRKTVTYNHVSFSCADRAK